MVTPLGFNAPASLAAIRAGISAVRATPWADPETGEPLSGTRVSLPQWFPGLGKLADLAAPAIQECLLAADPEPQQEIPLLLGVAAESRAGRPLGLDDELLDEIQARLELPRHRYSRLYPEDQFGCAKALADATALVERKLARRVVVAGVDSYLHGDTLEDYVQRRRLMTANNSNGFFPGEAAAAVLVGLSGSGAGVELQVLGVGFGLESATIDGTEPFQGRGMTDAVRIALDQAGLSLSDVAYRLTDISGEHYKFKEALFVAGRLDTGERKAALELWHPIEYLGEIGAAILPCLLAQAMHAAQEGYAPGPLAICHVGADAGARAALVVGLRRTMATGST